jgi:hypothetical protein
MDVELTPAQAGDIHQALNEHSRYWGTRIAEDYDGPGRPMVVFDRPMPVEGAIW